MLLVSGRDPETTCIKASMYVARVTRRIELLGLDIAETEAALLCGKATDGLCVHINGTEVPVTNAIKSLGVILDRGLTFKRHLCYVEEKADRVLRALWRLLPNLKGPGEAKRRLYVNIIHSVMLYAAPVWADQVAIFKTYRTPLLRIQRHMALRVISGYRTISYEAALLLARIPPVHFLASRHRRAYQRLQMVREAGEDGNETRREIGLAADLLMFRQWEASLEGEDLPGRRVREALLPVFYEWMHRKTGGLHYHLTQLMAGHGSFGDYLTRIGKRPSPDCPHCGAGVDSADHTIGECPAWDVPRRDMIREIGENLSWPAIVRAMVQGGEKKWKAVSTFATKVLTAKEVAEREKEKRKKEEEEESLRRS
ncbi:uncharacterized protein LOC112588879 [Harpegnathos saltator]|uniref:uncharacterized protein LOC112588879 n=1 Tax=Harpegnathos saltator TaxID=610380 RepID=UPI000DBEE1DB|nr:uncharacterized protein LOC112588879 [Harpegnathos saltator]